MAGLQAVISYGCDSSGSGYVTINSVSAGSGSGTITVVISGDSGGYSPSFPPTSLPYKMLLGSGEYTIECWQGTKKGSVKVNGATFSTAIIEIDCFECDIKINSVATTNANAPAANGSATVTATGTKGTKQYSLNGTTWQTSNVFNGLAIGNYTAYIKYQEFPGCVDQKAFTVKAVPVYGCTNPAAANYDPAANTDNGTCVFIPQFHATGGTMPNPIYIEREYSTTTGTPPKLKARHYVTLNLYNAGAAIPFASKIARVRNGKIKLDIAKDLQIGKLNLSVSNELILKDDDAMFFFEIGFIESYDGKSNAETRTPYPKRVAVRAALPKAIDSIMPYVLHRIPDAEGIPQAEFISAFDVPVKFADEPVCLSVMIDESAYSEGSTYNQLFLERSYFDSSKRLVQRISDQVFDSGFIRFEINDPVLPCVSYMEVCLNTDLREQPGECIDVPVVPPTVPPSQVQIQDGAGNVIANVNAGSVFMIESGFSFGFRIIG